MKTDMCVLLSPNPWCLQHQPFSMLWFKVKCNEKWVKKVSVMRVLSLYISVIIKCEQEWVSGIWCPLTKMIKSEMKKIMWANWNEKIEQIIWDGGNNTHINGEMRDREKGESKKRFTCTTQPPCKSMLIIFDQNKNRMGLKMRRRTPSFFSPTISTVCRSYSYLYAYPLKHPTMVVSKWSTLWRRILYIIVANSWAPCQIQIQYFLSFQILKNETSLSTL